MKTRLLFVMNNLTCGGAEKALVSLLQTLDYSRYEADLLLFKHEGLFMNQLPGQVNLLAAPPLYPLFDMSARKALKLALRRGKPLLAVSRLLAGSVYRRPESPAVREQRAWKYVSRALPRLDKTYDAAIGFLEKSPVYFVVDKVKASRKLGYVHNDYDRLGMDPALDDPFFRRLDAIVTVSDECGNVLRNRFPAYADKVRVVRNIVSPRVIRAMAEERPDWGGREAGARYRLVTVGRLVKQKGIDLALEACKHLVDGGLDVRWFVLGEGEERPELERAIRRLGMEDRFILLGQRENPYPYVKQADLYVQPSRFEGKPIAVDEAKILLKPIVLTNFSTARDQIQSGSNGVIVEMNARALGEGIRRLLQDEPLRAAFANRLAEENLGTESEIEKLYELF